MPAAALSDTYAAVTIGNFDGVHLGHAALVRAAREAIARHHGSNAASRRDAGRVVVLAFDPNPLAVLRPGAAPPQLTTFEQRRETLLALGADEVERLTPSREFLAQSPEQFIDWLVARYRPIAIAEGPDFRFGRSRAGSVETLREIGRSRGFETIVVDPVEVALSDQSLVRASSSMVRWLLAHGRVRDARLVLGRPFELRAPVVRGERRGRAIGVPTANLATAGESVLPADGIYMGFANAPDGARYTAAISIGTKPTFGDHPRVCEAHLVDYEGSLEEYGWTMNLAFHEWLRDQLAFDGVEALTAQLRRDIEWARALAARAHAVSPIATLQAAREGRG